MNVREFSGFEGRVSRTTYALTGILGVLIKHNLDRLTAARMLHVPWGISSYFAPIGMLSGNYPPSGLQQSFLLVLGLTSLPFIWLGMVMTVKRLREAGLPIRLAVLFFVPVINLLFFLVLCLFPSRQAQAGGLPREGLFFSWLPRNKSGIAVLSATIGAAAGTAMSFYAVRGLGHYGFTLFLAIPFFMGFLSTWLYTYHRPRSFGDCISVSTASVVLAGAFIIGMALDGFVCVLMAAPIALLLSSLGAYLAYAFQGIGRAESQSGAVFGLFLAIPLMASAEFLFPGPVPEFKTHTSIEIAAPPQIVWRHIVSFPRISEAPNPVFRMGIAYPLEAQITGSGLTADRQCIFSSGAFREPILAWSEGKHFAFGVSQEPLLMKEWSPYSDIHVRHLDDHDFHPERADFYLTELPDGRTRLDGYTTYQNRMWPGVYWRIYTDAILHQIHLRVFRQVKRLSENDAGFEVNK